MSREHRHRSTPGERLEVSWEAIDAARRRDEELRARARKRSLPQQDTSVDPAAILAALILIVDKPDEPSLTRAERRLRELVREQIEEEPTWETRVGRSVAGSETLSAYRRGEAFSRRAAMLRADLFASKSNATEDFTGAITADIGYAFEAAASRPGLLLNPERSKEFFAAVSFDLPTAHHRYIDSIHGATVPDGVVVAPLGSGIAAIEFIEYSASMDPQKYIDQYEGYRVSFEKSQAQEPELFPRPVQVTFVTPAFTRGRRFPVLSGSLLTEHKPLPFDSIELSRFVDGVSDSIQARERHH